MLVLPAPLGPMMSRELPGVTERERPATSGAPLPGTRSVRSRMSSRERPAGGWEQSWQEERVGQVRQGWGQESWAETVDKRHKAGLACNAADSTKQAGRQRSSSSGQCHSLACDAREVDDLDAAALLGALVAAATAAARGLGLVVGALHVL